MRIIPFLLRAGIALTLPLGAGAQAPVAPSSWPAPREGEFTVRDFQFRSGATLPEIRLHYRTLGAPLKDEAGRTTNAVLILHGTGGEGGNFLRPIFAGVLFGPGQLLDARKYFIILPDNIGHGRSSKPSDGLRGRFPHYEYADMIALQHALVTEGLKVNHLRLVMGTSMGCMHSFMWGETYPDEMDALMPLACLPVALAGRNRIWRKMVIDAIREDPAWHDGNYQSEPRAALRVAADMLLLAGSAPLHLQQDLPTRQAADEYLAQFMQREFGELDANDMLYALDASRNYDPSAGLERIRAALMHVNSADDFINPPELGIAEREVKRVPRGTFVLVPVSEQTYGHGTHTRAAVWQQHLQRLLEESARASATAHAP
jgi:homoserine O-acetyltransferase/O-succinyltransferase